MVSVDLYCGSTVCDSKCVSNSVSTVSVLCVSVTVSVNVSILCVSVTLLLYDQDKVSHILSSVV